jgi:hypothetical protein
MNPPKMQDGSYAWFVSRRSRTSYQLYPCSPAGWALLIAFCIAEALVSVGTFVLLDFEAEQPRLSTWLVWGTLFFGLMIAFIVVAIGHSVPAGQDRDANGRRKR